MASNVERGGSPEVRVADAFTAYFSNFEISIRPEEVVAGSRRTISKRGWWISYRVDPDHDGLPSLEFYAMHRMTNDRHVRIGADGVVQLLDAIHEAFAYDSNIPGSEEAARGRYLKHNRAVASELRARGLYPEPDDDPTPGGAP